MNQVILDDVLRAKLNGLNERLTICEPTGETVGHYLPHDQFLKLVYAWEKSTMSIDELKRRSAESGRMKLADFWKKMEKTS